MADSAHIILESEKKSTTVQETSHFFVTFLDNKLYDTMISLGLSEKSPIRST